MRKGQKISEETRIKMQLVARERGNNRGSGWKLSKEHKDKIGKANQESLIEYYKTHSSPRKGIHIQTNNALKEWRENGGQPWNKIDKETSINQSERRKFMRTIKNDVLKRDNYTCVLCYSKKDLQVDHIQEWSEFKELRFDPENCRTLCMSCHYKITFGKPLPEGMVWGHTSIRRVN